MKIMGDVFRTAAELYFSIPQFLPIPQSVQELMDFCPNRSV